MIPFDLEKALAGQPFASKLYGKAKSIHVVPAEFKRDCPILVLFDNGGIRTYSLETDWLYMLPVEVVKYANVYEAERFADTLEQAKQQAGAPLLGHVKLTFSEDGKLIKSEVIPL